MVTRGGEKNKKGWVDFVKKRKKQKTELSVFDLGRFFFSFFLLFRFCVICC